MMDIEELVGFGSYEPNEINSDMFLSQIPLSLMKENIKAQFEDPLEFRKKDHLSTFLNMYRYSKENVDAYEDEDLDNVIELRDDFYMFMMNIMQEYLGIGLVDFSNMSEEDQDNMIHFTYRFFIINIKKNFVSFIISYIEENKDRFLPDEETREKRKDVTTLSFKKEVTDSDDICIISNLSNIIDEILESEIDIDDFFKKCDMDCLETRFVSNAFDTFQITGNFFPRYAEMVDFNFRAEIESKIRNRILKKYKNK